MSLIARWAIEDPPTTLHDTAKCKVRRIPPGFLYAGEVEAVSADQLAGAVQDRVTLLRWIHETGTHRGTAEECKSCAALVAHLKLSGGQ